MATKVEVINPPSNSDIVGGLDRVHNAVQALPGKLAARLAALRENVLEYRKVATVLAGAAPVGGIIPTLEGDHTYEAGDYICGPGQAGEFWPVKRSIFEATYVPVTPTEAKG